MTQKSIIGLDPFAWLADGKDNSPSSRKKPKNKTKKKVAKKKLIKKNTIAKTSAVKKKTKSVKSTPRKKASRKAVVACKNKTISPLGLDVESQESSINGLLPQADALQNPIIQSSIIKLSPVQDISHARELYTQVAAQLDKNELIFDGGEVERIDTACLQLLTCVVQNACARGASVRWQAPSEALRKSAQLLGLEQNLHF
ncbi:STAS domain-containing protein [Beggiatoa alba]|nr:STAS domain-containing protein [Beggiatoa alba]